MADDVLNTLTSLTDAGGRVSDFAHDILHRLALRANPLGQSESFTYNSPDNHVTGANAGTCL